MFHFHCPTCQREGTVEVCYSDVELAIEGAVSSHMHDAPDESSPSPPVDSPSGDSESDSQVDPCADSIDVSKDLDNKGTTSTVGLPTNRDPTSQPGPKEASEQKSDPESTESRFDSGSELDDSVNANDYETVIEELAAVKKAGVRDLRERSEVKRVAGAIGHNALIRFLQNADDAAYRMAVQETTESAE